MESSSMDRRRNEKVSRTAGFARIVLVGCLAACTSAGCASRTLTITQDDRINNAMHRNRPPKLRTGDPLEVSIVCVYPKDLKREDAANERLKPGSGITSREWYELRPIPGPSEAARFPLPAKQIYLLTNENEVYGQVKRGAVNGAVIDGREEIKVSGIHFSGWKLHSKNSVIYVFPKFIGLDGKVLPVPPAVYSPPGAYASKLTCRIGVEEGRKNEGQYIENTTKRRLHGSGERK